LSQLKPVTRVQSPALAPGGPSFGLPCEFFPIYFILCQFTGIQLLLCAFCKVKALLDKIYIMQHGVHDIHSFIVLGGYLKNLLPFFGVSIHIAPSVLYACKLLYNLKSYLFI
jgi:hypothetical protein